MAEHEDNADIAQSASQPGQVIAPGDSSAPPEQAVATPVPEAQPSMEEAPTEPEAPTPFMNDNQPKPPAIGNQSISWTASEYIAHEKSAGWYFALIAGALVLAGVIYAFTKDFITCGVILFCALILGIFARRTPRELDYRIDDSGIQIGPKHYPLEQFRSFSVVPEGAFSSIVFMPLKRFAPLLTVYYAPENEEAIVTILSNWLPMEEAKADLVDSFMRRIRF